MEPFIISVSGMARAGKNTFCNLLQDELYNRLKLSSCQMSFAAQLRKDIEEFARFCGFDVFDEKNKEDYRPLMLWYAALKRKQTNGRYFINQLEKRINKLNNIYPVIMISDCRYAENEYDELQWSQKRGIVVHISKYKKYKKAFDPHYKKFDAPPNEFEAKNDPILKEKANYLLQWEDVGKNNTHLLNIHIQKFVDWLEPKLKERKLIPLNKESLFFE